MNLPSLERFHPLTKFFISSYKATLYVNERGRIFCLIFFPSPFVSY